MENWKERFRNQFVDTYGEKDSKEWRIAYQPIEELEDFISKELDKARREYFSMGMEYFSLIDDSNIYQKKGWKLPEEKAERLQILDKMFNLLKDNK